MVEVHQMTEYIYYICIYIYIYKLCLKIHITYVENLFDYIEIILCKNI